VFSVVLVTLLFHPFFAGIPLLRGKCETVQTLASVETLVSDHLSMQGFEKMVVARAGHLQEYALASDQTVKQWKVVAYKSFRNSLIIH